MEERIKNVLNEQINNLQELKTSGFIDNMVSLAQVLTNCIRNGNKILICGNGGSAADSQHFAAELVGRFKKERKGLGALALTTDTSILTSMGNDYGYDMIFSRQVEAIGKEGDILIGISTSGNSKNIIEAVNQAKNMGIKTIGFLGKDGGVLKNICDYNVTFNYSETARVQEHHIMTIHLLCEFIENNCIEVGNEER